MQCTKQWVATRALHSKKNKMPVFRFVLDLYQVNAISVPNAFLLIFMHCIKSLFGHLVCFGGSEKVHIFFIDASKAAKYALPYKLLSLWWRAGKVHIQNVRFLSLCKYIEKACAASP